LLSSRFTNSDAYPFIWLSHIKMILFFPSCFLFLGICFLFVASNCFCQSQSLVMLLSTAYWFTIVVICCGFPISFLPLFLHFLLYFTVCHSLLHIFPFWLCRSVFVWSWIVLELACRWIKSISFFNNFIISLAELSSWYSLPTSIPRFRHCMQFLFVFHLPVGTLFSGDTSYTAS
jgi:hypothetical protein